MTAARRLYRLHIALACLGLLVAAGSAALAASQLSLGMPSTHTLAAACDRWIPALTAAQVLVVALAMLTLTVAILGLRSLRRHVISNARDLRRVRRSCEPANVAGTPCRLFRHPEPHAFCGGFLW